jgi:hypothetical protein
MYSWSGILSPVFWLVLTTAICIALFVPDEFARANRTAQRFATTLRNAWLRVSPYTDINAHACSTPFPHAALLSHSVMWASIAFLFVFNTLTSTIYWRYWIECFRVFRPHLRLPMKKRDAAIGLAGMLTLPFVFSIMGGSTSVVGGADLSRLVFAFMTGAVLFIWQMPAIGWLPLFYTVISRYLTKVKPCASQRGQLRSGLEVGSI